MADNEYIKRSEVVCLIEEKIKRCDTVLETLAFASLRTKVMGLRSADVAPRAEVAREIFEEIEEYAELQIASLNIAEKVYSSGAAFFGGGKQAFVLLLDRLAELKKKYTEAEPPKGD